MVLTENIIVLTHEQEKIILDYVMGLNTEDAGCARMVFPFSTELEYKLGLRIPFPCIVKVAMGIGGYRQNQLEIKTYLECCDFLPLAEIAAYGRFVEIMERVEVEDWRDFYDDYSDVDDYMDYVNRRENETEEEFSERYDRTYESATKAVEAMEALNDHFGFTGDNGQIGINRYGNYVAYDYGYTTNRHTGEQVSDISDSVYDKDDRNLYIQGLFDLLDKEEHMLEEYENRFLHDENGDDSYTRYEIKYVRQAPDWMGTKFDCGSMSYFKTYEDVQDVIKEAPEEWKFLAYTIDEVIYNIDESERSRETLEVHIPAEYREAWEKKHQK